ncbi:transmembrane protein, putative (macronuclear) [Tetrahymena thermophila SB210]|uniref:Transmembrane protein, putative n=1 Tax=Tetrahymena thermophila (strain SB210) TaxID=312017 RepID=W7X640_TETTS|nr:transmembrane protein, putative [Tetrahymena thermophila SB210]EWS71793.1 transmembrane protein, putative [Tetrahymena thermophila SB210]|eukprot:XP_012655680.1 transmembrane protein, putative [Tetrahymena thermophila SB210]
MIYHIKSMYVLNILTFVFFLLKINQLIIVQLKIFNSKNINIFSGQYQFVHNINEQNFSKYDQNTLNLLKLIYQITQLNKMFFYLLFFVITRLNKNKLILIGLFFVQSFSTLQYLQLGGYSQVNISSLAQMKMQMVLSYQYSKYLFSLKLMSENKKPTTVPATKISPQDLKFSQAKNEPVINPKITFNISQILTKTFYEQQLILLHQLFLYSIQ